MPNGRRSSRMSKQWNSIPSNAADLVASGTTILMASLSFAVPGTVIRMIGEYIAAPTSPLVAGDEAGLFVGIGIASSDAVALGSTALPDAADVGFP